MSMTMKYRFDEEYRLKNISFEGLDGRERVTSTKEALNVMKIENPIMAFADAIKAGRDVPDEAAETINFIHNLWRYPDAPPDCPANREMNPLALLANAIQVITWQKAKLRRYRQKQEQ